MSECGLIVESYGYNYVVFYGNKRYQAVTKGKNRNIPYVVGDLVIAQFINERQLLINELIPRVNLVYRSYANKQKIIASNITQLIIIIAIKPHFSFEFLNRALICAESQNITPIIVVNKYDLCDTHEFFNKILELYEQQLHYKVINLNATNDCQTLHKYLINHKSLLIGQSGVGKSTIINQVINDANSKTADINKAQTSGCHTTTHSSLYFLNHHKYHEQNNYINNISQYHEYIIDSPGLHEFGLSHLLASELIHYFPECRIFIGLCKFRDCKHLNEPHCAIIKAVTTNHITQKRYELLQLLMKQLQ